MKEGNMDKPVLWSVDETRRSQLEVIVRQLGLTTYPQFINMVINECISQHGIPAKPEPPKETEPDKFHRTRIAQMAHSTQSSPTQVRRDIQRLSANELHDKYAMDPRSIPEFQKYINRTK
jgi:antitoxin component of RelBE/YafQ-DinJ toxin-antitoxin module